MIMFVSVIIPARKIDDYLRRETVPALRKQTHQNFELIIVPDKYEEKEEFPSFARVLPSWPKTSPGDKRDLAVKKARGDIIAFTDDDAYPDKNWLKNAIPYFQNPKIAAVCGPGITPPTDNLGEKVSGWVWGSTLGAKAVGTHRCRPEAKRYLDDFPAFNLIVRKSDFLAVSGFNTHFWPGEDTKLCYKLVYELGKKIIYDPKTLVYHHRRPVFIPHLIQIARYGIHRGYLARTLPKTSRRVGYFMPSVFVIWLLLGPIFLFFLKSLLPFYFLPILAYLLLLLVTSIRVFRGEKNLKASFLLMLAIFTTHLVYGVMFAKGLLSRELKQ